MTNDEFGGIPVESRDEFGGVAVDSPDEFGGVPVSGRASLTDSLRPVTALLPEFPQGGIPPDARMPESQDNVVQLQQAKEMADKADALRSLQTPQGTAAANALDAERTKVLESAGVATIGAKDREPMVKLPRMGEAETIPGKIGSGLVNAGAGLIESLTTPENVGLLPFASEKAITQYFASSMLSGVPAGVKATIEAPTLQSGVESAATTAASAYLGGKLMSEASAPKVSEANPELVRLAPLTAKAVDEGSVKSEMPTEPVKAHEVLVTPKDEFGGIPIEPAPELIATGAEVAASMDTKARPAETVLENKLPAEAPEAVIEPLVKAADAAVESPLVDDIVADAKAMLSPKDEPLGFTVPGYDAATEAYGKVREIAKEALSIRKMDDLTRSVLGWSGKLQRSFGEVSKTIKSIDKAVRDPVRQDAITNWIEADGDLSVLKDREIGSTDYKLREGYAKAQSLTPEETAIAQSVKTVFNDLFKRAEKYDVVKSFRDNYVNHIWDRKPEGSPLTSGSKRLNDSFRFSKARTFPTFFDGEAAGYKPKTKAIGKLLPVYIHELNSAIAAKQLVEDLSRGVAKDGRPLVSPRGVVEQIEGDNGKATLVLPRVPTETETIDYKTMENQPALHEWRWRAKDSEGNPILMRSDLALHPEAAAKFKSVLGQSAIREWYGTPTSRLASIPKSVVKGIDTASSTMKETMLGLMSTFHQVQEGTHAVGHKINPFFNIPKIDLEKFPEQQDAANHGLMLNPDRISARQFSEGLGKTGIISRIPVLGPVADAYADFLFHRYIPGLKIKTYQKILERNTSRLTEEVKSGDVSVEDIKLLSAEQTNAAYGHLNYADLGRDPTIQHLLQMTLLAPDFLEARGRFVGQAAKALAGSKAGREQLTAIALLAAAQASGNWVAAQLIPGAQWDKKHPFEITVGSRRYTMRSVPEDLVKLFTDTRRFSYGRMNPLIGKGTVQLLTGLNYRGEKVSATDTMEELLAQYIPITARWIPGVKELTQTSKARPVSPLEEFAGSMGMHVSRYSPITEIYKLASKWKDESGSVKDTGTYPVSKYQQLRYALEDGDLDRAKEEYDKLLVDATARKIREGFHSSVNHPFTGTKESDRAFVDSLSDEDKALYELALDKRAQIIQRFFLIP